MDKTKVSIILPSLNVVQYIEECIQSVLRSRLREIEILCVDAGSTDGTLDVINKYINIDKRIKLIQSDIKSYGYQVNIGIEEAKGEYIGIVDTDDFVDCEMYQFLYSEAIKNDKPDYIKGTHDMFIDFDDEQRLFKAVPTIPHKRKELMNRVLNIKEWPEILLYDAHIWKGIYRKDFLVENNIRLNESPGAAFQDNGMLFQTICYATRALYLDKPLYKYRRDNENASVYNKAGFKYVYNEYEFIWKFLKLNSENVSYFGLMYWKRYFNMFRFQMEVLVRQNRDFEDFEEDIEFIRQRFIEGYRSGDLDFGVFTGQQWREIEIFMNSTKKFYEYIQFVINVERSKINNWINQIYLKEKIVIFGKGDIGSSAYFLLKKYNVNNMIGWCDNNLELCGKDYMGKRVYSLNELLKIGCDDISYVIATADYTYDIRSQLIREGIHPDKIIHYSLGANPLMLLM